jgi:hypothetical protein
MSRTAANGKKPEARIQKPDYFMKLIGVTRSSSNKLPLLASGF